MSAEGSLRRLVAAPITHASFAPFGGVVSCDRDDVLAAAANLGSADRRDFILEVQNARPNARLNLATFRCRPWKTRPLRLATLEKHPASTQVFVPMTPGPYLVLVAKGAVSPDVTTARAFLVEGGVGIGYAPGVWHHPMVALTRAIDFSCIVWEDGSALDCVTCALDEPIEIAGLPA